MEVQKSKNISLITIVIIAICSFFCPLAKAEDVSDYISGIYIYQIRDYGVPTDSEDLMYEFNLEVNASFEMAGNMDADVASIEILAPAGYTFQIPKQPGGWSDDIWTSYEYIEEEFLPGFWLKEASWKYRARLSNIADLQAYGDGEYTIIVNLEGGGQYQTKALFGNPDTDESIPQPTQEPVLTFPLQGQEIEPPFTFTGEPCIDTEVEDIFIEIIDPEKNIFHEQYINVNETSWGPISLTEGLWEIVIYFEHYVGSENDDGISISAAKYSKSKCEFTVLDYPYTRYEVWGGDTLLSVNSFFSSYWYENELEANGYVKLGESDGRIMAFQGEYEYYVIPTWWQFNIDSIQGSDDSYLSSGDITHRYTANITDSNNIYGAPDGLCATIGEEPWYGDTFSGYFVFNNPGSWEGLTVITRNINIENTITNTPEELKEIGSGDIITYRISFDTLDLTDNVTDVFIEDYLPDEVNFLSDNAIFGFYSESEHKYIWLDPLNPSLSPGTTRELLLTVQINPDVPVGTEIINFVTIDCNETPATTASVTFSVNKAPPLEIEDIQITSGTIIRDDISSDVTISMELPEGIGLDDIDAEEPIVLNLDNVQISAYDRNIEEIDQKVQITVLFDTAAVLDVLPGYGQFDVEITGQLKDGRTFSGQTTITIAGTELTSDYISKIYFDQFWNYESPTDSNDEAYEFYIKISADYDKAYNMDSDVNHIEVSTPAGYTFKIQKLPGQWSNDIWTSYEYEEEELLPGIWNRNARWEYRILFSDIADLQDYGDGEYTITLHYNNSSHSQTTAWFGMADSQNPVPQPPEPIITYPLPNQIVESPITCSWESFGDANTSSIWIGLEEKTNGGFKEGDFDVNETSWEPIYLTNGKWEVTMIFDNSSIISNRGDGIEIESYKYSQSRYDFKVINYLTNTYEVWGGDIWIDPLEGSYGSIADMNDYGYEKLIVDPNNTGTFFGEYNYYVIATKGEFLLDSIQGLNGSYYNKFGTNVIENVINEDNLLGEPDGLCATIGNNNPLEDYSGWLVFENPDGWQGIIVNTRKLNISKKAVNTPEELENISPGDTITYMISFDSSEMLHDVNNVIIVDYMPDEVSYISADTNEVYGFYDANEHTFVWSSSSLSWGSAIELPLTVKVNMGVAPDTIITNFVTIDSNETPATAASSAVTVSKNQQRETIMQIIPDTISRNGVDVSGVMVILEMPSDVSEEQILINELLVLSLDSEDSGVPVIANADQDVIPYEGVLYVVAVFDKTQLLSAIPGYGQKKIKVEGKLIEGSFIGTGILTIN